MINADLARLGRNAGHADVAVRAFEAVSRITRTHRIGNDSAQNELAIAELLILKGEFVAAEDYLEEARRIIARAESAYDAAILAHRWLQLRQRRDGDQMRGKVLKDAVEQCAELYGACDRADLAKAMRAEMTRFAKNVAGKR